nr:MAG TPA: hypothetical protein [Caudoviricetes sp.]
MDNYKELAQLVQAAAGKASLTLMQGIVRKVDGVLCDVELGNITVPDVRLRASEAAESGQLLITPAIGSAVIVGSLSGDLTQLVVLAVDRAESIVINGGELGGLINIEPLTQKINDLIKAINSHTHQGAHGPTGPPLQPVKQFNKGDYEDNNIKH